MWKEKKKKKRLDQFVFALNKYSEFVSFHKKKVVLVVLLNNKEKKNQNIYLLFSFDFVRFRIHYIVFIYELSSLIDLPASRH